LAYYRSTWFNDSCQYYDYGNPCRSTRSGDSGRTGSLRSRAWMAVLSSTQNTATCFGGFNYSPMDVGRAALKVSNGSSEGSTIYPLPVSFTVTGTD